MTRTAPIIPVCFAGLVLAAAAMAPVAPARADSVMIGGDATAVGVNGVQTVVAIGSGTSAIAETGAVTGNVRVLGSVSAVGVTGSQSAIGLGAGASAYAGTGAVSGNVAVGGSIRVHGVAGDQVAIDVGIPDAGLFSYSCIGCVANR